MPSIDEVRQQYPQYNDMSDGDLAGALHQKFYSDMPREEFDKKVGLSASKAAPSKSAIPAAIRDIPTEIYNSAAENVSAIKKGLTPSGQGDRGFLERSGDLAKGLMGVPGLVLSPITGTARSIGGHVMADVEHAAGTVINPEVAAKDDPQKMYEAAKGDVDLAMAAGRPKTGFSATPPPIPPSAAAPVPVPVAATDSLGAAAGRISDATGTPVEVPRAIASDNIAVQRSGQAIRNIPIVGDAIPKSTTRLGDQLEGATNNIAAQYGDGSGPNVAHKIGQTIGASAEQESQAARIAAQSSDQTVLAEWERAHQGAMQTIANHEGAALQQARQSVGNMSPQDMGETLVARLRAGEQEARATKDRLYGIAGESDGAITAEETRNLRPRVQASLADAGREVDATLTPASNRMMEELNSASFRRNPDVVNGAVAPVEMRTIEQTRKRLNNFAQAATNDADRAAARHIIREFDGWLGDAFDNALFSGSDRALQAFREARAANTDWRTRYGYNARDDADRIVNRIVTGEVTPQEVANYVVGSTKVGSKGVSSRLLTRLGEATGGDPEAMGAIRGGVWNKLAETTDGVAAKTPEKIANDINEFLHGSGRDVANRLFSESQRNIMRSYAQTLRTGIEARGVVADMAANTRPSAMEVGVGPFQQLANQVLGKGAGRADEALFTAINAYAKSGAKGDINLLSKVLQAVPETERGNLAGAIIKNMGVSPRSGQFSPDVFVSAWNTYKPEAKSLLFGMSGPQRVALDDIAKISQRMKEVGSKFGNPSGTAQNVNLLGLATAFMAAPLSTISAGLGGAVVAKVLSSPVGASSVSKWSRAYEAAATRNTEGSRLAFQRATALLAANIHQDAGLPIKDVIRRLQGPVPAGANDEKH